MITIALVAAGAFLGAPLRYLIEGFFTKRQPTSPQPIGLLVVNLLGSVLAGIAITAFSGPLRTFVLVGLCGTLTTYSGFGWYVVQRFRSSRGSALITIALMTGGCALAFWLGLAVTQRLVGS